MAPRQKTFQLIPDPVGHPDQGHEASSVLSKPPMTTKQAKKLYRQKNQGPKLSKAEQRRIELMEQDRIRKEFEKEKAQARARTTRERKREKEEKEKEGRRRKGLPLIDIHPSQDTISNFINRMGFGRKPISNGVRSKLYTVKESESETVTEGELETETDGGTAHEDEDEASEKENQQPGNDIGERPAKRRRNTHIVGSPSGILSGKPSGKLLDRMIHIPSQRTAGVVAKVARQLGPESWSRASSVGTDDAATETMLEEQLIADVELASSRSMANSSPIKLTPVKEVAAATVHPQAHQQAQPMSPRPPPRYQEAKLPNLPVSGNLQTAKIELPAHMRTDHGEDIFKKPTSPFVPRPGGNVVFKYPAPGVPSAPPRFKAPAEPHNSKFARPRFLPPHIQTPRAIPVQVSPTYAGSRRTVTETVNDLPTSTQLFVLDHAEELFPSASQEAQELLDDQHPAPEGRPIAGLPCLVHDSLEPPCRTVAAPVTISHPHPPFISCQHKQTPSPRAAASLDFPFLSTQDFFLSTQDIMELETPSKVQDPKPQKVQIARPFAKTDDLRTKLQEGPAPGRNCITELQVPIESNAPRPTLATSPRADHDIGVQRSISASGSGTVVQANIRIVQATEATGLPSRVNSPQRLQSPKGPKDRRQSTQPPSQVLSRTTVTPHESRGKASPFNQNHSSTQAIAHVTSSSPPLSSGMPCQKTTLSETMNAIATTRVSPPKKRMFGSSGPGAEVLVAMERSYRENIQEKRRREEELRAQAAIQQETEVLAQELADILDDDDMSDGVMLREDTKPQQPALADRGVYATEELRQPSGGTPNGKTELPASQETDYGDFDFEAGGELDILADMAWVDDDLDGF